MFEMICADFLAGANMENEDPEVLLQSALRFFKFLPGHERQKFVHRVTEKRRDCSRPKRVRVQLDPEPYEELHNQVRRRDGWRCQSCGTMSNLEVHHEEFRSHSGHDCRTLITCAMLATLQCITVEESEAASRLTIHDSSFPAPYVLTKNFAVVCKTLHIALNWQKFISAVKH